MTVEESDRLLNEKRETRTASDRHLEQNVCGQPGADGNGVSPVEERFDIELRHIRQQLQTERQISVVLRDQIAMLKKIPPPPPLPPPTIGDDLLWGINAIAAEIGRSPSQTNHMVENGRIPCGKMGGQWVANRRHIHDAFDRLTAIAIEEKDDA